MEYYASEQAYRGLKTNIKAFKSSTLQFTLVPIQIP